MYTKYKVKLLLENKDIVECFAISKEQNQIYSELVFNTSMSGYQEIFTDPSYLGQSIVMSYPLIGNYGLNEIWNQSLKPRISALIAKEVDDQIVNWLYKENIPIIFGLDTRDLILKIRNGYVGKCLLDYNLASDNEELFGKLLKFNLNTINEINKSVVKERINIPGYTGKNILLIDCGCKQGIIDSIAQFGHNISIVRYDEDLIRLLEIEKFDKLIISNGACDPRDMKNLIDNIKRIIGKIDIYGICFGHQIIGLALNCEVYKMKFGHRGANHPVQDRQSGKVFLVSQNHSFAIKEDSLPNEVEVTFINLNDKTIEGIRSIKNKIEGVQFHPESCPGTNDARVIFEKWFGNL